jgi:hypothetical protein
MRCVATERARDRQLVIESRADADRGVCRRAGTELEGRRQSILGWCVHGLVKHYADAAWITVAAQTTNSPLAFTYPKLREVLHDKLEVMRELSCCWDAGDQRAAL